MQVWIIAPQECEVAPSPLKIPHPYNAFKVGVSLCESPPLMFMVVKSCFATLSVASGVN
ncbi:hypothetical protein [Helicobacter labetoulli]|uniref:hypothetical protein n=1 Tax=Helicobacter labetoulli TaxID=2315333 RepID=UPI001ABF5ADA|nr:hypothetical protein [Helicobacter labetoulli]